MHNPYLTIERVVALNPCRSAEKIQAWYPGRKRVRLSTVLRDDRISAADRIWLATRVLPLPVVDRWLAVVVERAASAAWAARAAEAAWEAERGQQIADLLEIIKTYKETKHA